MENANNLLSLMGITEYRFEVKESDIQAYLTVNEGVTDLYVFDAKLNLSGHSLQIKSKSKNISRVTLDLPLENAVSLANFFKNCESINTIRFGKCFRLSNIKDMQGYFSGLKNIKEVMLSEVFDFRATTNIDSLFADCESLERVLINPKIQFRNLKTAKEVFKNCRKLNCIVFPDNMHTSRVTSFRGMFNGCENLEHISFGENFRFIKDVDLTDMFKGCTSLKTIDLCDINEIARVGLLKSLAESNIKNVKVRTHMSSVTIEKES